MTIFLLGTQVAYVPPIARGNLKHDTVRYGFVVGVSALTVQVRFFTNKSNQAIPLPYAESVRRADLVIYNHHYQSLIDSLL